MCDELKENKQKINDEFLEQLERDLEIRRGFCQLCGTETTQVFVDGTYCEDCVELMRNQPL